VHALGEYERARQLHEDTLSHRRQVLGEEHPHTLLSADNLAADLRVLGEHERARQLEEHVRSPADLDLLPRLLLVLAAYLAVVERSRLTGGHRAATRSGLDRAGVAWTVTSRGEGTTRPMTAPPDHHMNVGIAAGRLGAGGNHPRPPGRPARARLPGRAQQAGSAQAGTRGAYQPGHGRAAAGGALIP